MVLSLDDSDLAVLNDALVRLPYGHVAPLIAKINEQIGNQHRLAAEQDEWQPRTTLESAAPAAS